MTDPTGRGTTDRATDWDAESAVARFRVETEAGKVALQDFDAVGFVAVGTARAAERIRATQATMHCLPASAAVLAQPPGLPAAIVTRHGTVALGHGRVGGREWRDDSISSLPGAPGEQARLNQSLHLIPETAMPAATASRKTPPRWARLVTSQGVLTGKDRAERGAL